MQNTKKSLTVDDVDQVVKEAVDLALKQLRNGTTGGARPDWISNHELFEALRAAFAQQQITNLIVTAKELWIAERDKIGETAAEKKSRDAKGIELIGIARQVLGQLAIHMLSQSLVIPNNNPNDNDVEKTKERIRQIKLSRVELAKVLAVLAQPFQEQLAKDPHTLGQAQALATTLLQPVVDQQLKHFEELKAQLQETRIALGKTEAAVEKLVKAPQAILDLLEKGQLRDRYENNYPEEKGLIADYLANHVFHECVWCFLQASTTIVHLADLLRSTGLKKDSLVHTNSTVFAYLMLGRNPEYQIYTVCGKTHDPLCGGWLFDNHDAIAQSHLRDLFRRTSDKLSLAIVTPQFLTADGKAWFAKPETTLLVRILLEEAERVIVTSPAQRVYASEQSLHADNGELTFSPVALVKPSSSGEESKQSGRELEFVVAGKLANLPDGKLALQQMAERLNATCRYKSGKDHPDWEKLHGRGN